MEQGSRLVCTYRFRYGGARRNTNLLVVIYIPICLAVQKRTWGPVKATEAAGKPGKLPLLSYRSRLGA